jgi:MerR family transcriptional regulator, copper efflux regulator
MLIKQFCEATGLPRDTVRFYVKRGLLKPTIGSRSCNRYQHFDAAQVERAMLIRSAQGLGFTLRQIGELAKDYEQETLSAEDRVGVLRAQLVQITTRERDLREMRRYLEAKLLWLESGASGAQPTFDLARRSKPSA